MRLGSTIKRNQLPQHFLNFLGFEATFNIKFTSATFTLIFLNLGLVYLLYLPFPMVVYYLVLPLIIMAHIWMIRLLCKNPYTVQYEFIWFMGIIGVIGSVLYLVLFQGIAYFMLGLSTLLFLFSSNVIFVIATFVFLKYQMNKYSDITKKRKTDYIYHSGLLTVGPGIGYIIGQAVMRHSEYLTWLVLFCIFLFFSLFLSYVAAKFIYKALFMRANWHLVVFQKPLKRDRKKFREKGLVLK
ncbi:hypothetical protein HXA34_11580 [Salipaludibacillus agaradhaerens]|uniref:hypothetical protein n=1 Tax=Salipaludibacillus agaradhaerens TaxID=76935 RepID=UPI0021506F38|nr:hypothetical protein [Salipaludibacillus agaradhaerens]MCR6106929.1 hypothetical protein [Salipaludibacillus agaradhaerens]MCR6118961.1 hypothetical protein [Salipaludibacillus agaradhaerens]